MSPIFDFESLPAGTVVFEQLPGVRFPGLPRIVLPTGGAASGAHALSSARPGEEFNTGPLVVEFLTPQRFVRLRAGLDRPSDIPVQATLHAFDAGGGLVAEQGPIPIGPGPTPVTTAMHVEVPDARIVRVALEFSGAFAEVIDDLEFSTAGREPPPDTSPPTVTMIQPAPGSTVTGDFFLLEAEIVEDRRLRSLTLSIANDNGTDAFPLSFSGTGPTFRVGPVQTGPLASGDNTVELTAEDFAGNTGTATVSINRTQIEGTLVLTADDPIVLPRIPRFLDVAGDVQETFPGSLAGRKLLTVRVISPPFVNGRVQIRDPLNDPDTRFTLRLAALPSAPVGPTSIAIEVLDEVSREVLSSASLRASITPPNSVDCGAAVPLYRDVSLESFAADINRRIDIELSGAGRSVAEADSDIGLPLRAFSAREKHVGSARDRRYTVGDPIYTDNSGQGIVGVGEERLANAPVGGDGSIVAANDSDVGTPLVRFADNERFVDVNENGQMDGGFLEPVYRDEDGSGTVSEGDLRLAKSLIAPSLLAQTPMTVQYGDDPFGAGLLHVHQRYIARPGGFFEADIEFIATLRVFLDSLNENADRIRFEYEFLFVRADPNPIPGPVDIPGVAGKFEDRFRTDFAEPFRARLGPAIAGEIRNAAENEGLGEDALLLLLQDVRITDREFVLGFCVPRNQFPDA